jgi:sugar/nucleoside kinase (ribokinase family)
MYDIVGIGSVLVDELVLLPEFPEPDTKIEIINTVKQLGGPVPTSLRLLSELDLKTAFIGKVGNDANAIYIKNKLKNCKVDISGLIEEEANSGSAQVWIDLKHKTRTIAYSSGSLTQFKKSDFIFHQLPDARLLHIDGRNNEIIKDLIRHYKNRGTKISIDTGNFREKTLEILEFVDLITMPRRFAVSLFGDISMKTLARRAREKYPLAMGIVITDGVNGSVCSANDEIIVQPVFEIEAFDTTGAGDVHAGGLLYGVFNSWSFRDTLRFAAACSAIKCLELGNKDLPNLQRVYDFMAREKLRQNISI